MFTNLTQIVCGDVVSCGASAFVVQEIADDELVLFRLEHHSNTKHRADIVVDHWADLALSGLPLRELVIRCVAIRRYGTANLIKLGTIPEHLKTRISTALKREQIARRFEDSAPVQSNLLASTASRGRRVGAVRYA